MMDWRRWILAVGVAVFGGAYLAAQEASDEDTTITVSPVDDTKLSVAEMTAQAKAAVAEVESIRGKVRKGIEASTAEKDTIKLDCLGNADQRLTGLLDVATNAMQELERMPSGDRERATFQFQKAIVSKELALEAASEASSCAGGDELAFGEDTLEVKGPEVRDDPTRDKKRADGYSATDPEDAAQGSPF